MKERSDEMKVDVQRLVLPVGQVVLGDNCEVMRQWPSESVDLVVTSPPYDDLREYGKHGWDFYGVAWNLARLLKPGGVIVWNVADMTKDGGETGTSMRQALHFQTLGLTIYDTMIYHKENPVPLSHPRYEQAWEYCFILSKGKPSRWNPIKEKSAMAGKPRKVTAGNVDGEQGHSMRRRDSETIIGDTKTRSNVWKYTIGTNATTKDKGAFAHPALMPEGLAKDHVQSWSDPGDVVLDPFAGAGTTLKAAKEFGRQWVGIEVNPEYVEICHDRTAQEVLAL